MGIFHFLYFSFGAAVILHVQGQVQTGYISIDCGSQENFNFVDRDTGISYTSDGAFVSTGINKNISSEYAYPNNLNLPQPLSDLRYFPQDQKNCYTLRPTGGRNSLNLIRASFMYGNYDGENRLPEFDLYLDVNLWSTVKFHNASDAVYKEIISVASADTYSICLINTGTGTPFISALELRPLNGSIYHIEQRILGSLILFQRLDIGFVNGTGRYSDDIYDRFWSPYISSSWDSISNSSDIDTSGDGYKAPLEVMKTAAKPRNESEPLELSWNSSDSNSQFYVYLYFADLEVRGRNQSREFNVSWNGIPLFGPLIPRPFYATTMYNSRPLEGSEHRLSIYKTGNSTLPPILNAIEIYVVQEFKELATFSLDVDAINGIKSTYRVDKNWVGDPCGPKNYSWEGLRCNYGNSNASRIISINLTSSGLTGQIAASIANLSSLEILDLSNNSLSGVIPEFLSELSFLKYLNLEGNQLSGSVPTALLDKSMSGLLTLSVDFQNLCNSGSCKKKRNVVVPIVASLSSALVLLLVLIIIWRIRRKGKTENPDTEATSNEEGKALESKQRQFSYPEVINMTDNFKTAIGKGGFGTVYRGHMKDSSQVAVKLLSSSSSQGYREFRNEAELLMRVHHRNLTLFVGYCHDGDKMALIYEYMANGSLKDYISDTSEHALSWEMRLKIAIDAAQGLEYLHHGCRPPIIHRDVKSANILLSESLDAKISDFGLSKGLLTNESTDVLTDVIGTTGYLDPVYYRSKKLNEKSDVYSFGIVLFELITGQPAIIKSMDHLHIIEYVSPFLERGEITSIVDKTMGTNLNSDSVWKALQVAVACTMARSIQRPTMSDVLTELKKCLAMESGQGRRVQKNKEDRKIVFLNIDHSPEACSTSYDSMSVPLAR